MKLPSTALLREARRHPVAGAAVATGATLAALAIGNVVAARRAEARNPPSGRFVEIDGIPVHYLEAGSGPPIVLLHGNGATAEEFIISGLFERLAARYRVIAPDRPGFGYTARPRNRIWMATAQARLVRGLVERLGLTRPIVVGHSWGALVALALALDEGPALGGLALLSGYYFPTARADVVALSGPAVPVIGDAMRFTVSPLLGRAVAPALIRRIFAPRPVPRRFQERFPIDLALRPSQIRASAEDTALMIPSAAALQGRYGEIDLPVLIVAGADDRIVTTERQAERLHREIPGSQLEVLPGVGHMVHYAAPDRIAGAIDRLAAG